MIVGGRRNLRWVHGVTGPHGRGQFILSGSWCLRQEPGSSGWGPSVHSGPCDSSISGQVDVCPAGLLLKGGEIMPIFFPWLVQGSCEIRAPFLNPFLPCPELAWARTGGV